MNKINSIPFHNCNISLKGNKHEAEQLACSDNKCKNYSNEYMSSGISSASRAYGLSFINKNKTIPQMSLKDMVQWFETQGKVEGKDFEIDSSCSMGNTLLILKNKQGQEELTIHYDNGNHNSWSGYEVSEYKNGKLCKQTSRDYNGNINCNLQVYDKNDERIHHLQESLTFDTTPEEYIKYLNDNNINYNIEYTGDEENNRSIHIDVLDANKKETKGIWYYYGENKFDEHCQFVSQSDINENGEEYRRLMFNKDNVEVVTYVNYL